MILFHQLTGVTQNADIEITILISYQYLNFHGDNVYVVLLTCYFLFCRLLYSLAFNTKFMKILWGTCTHVSNTTVTG